MRRPVSDNGPLVHDLLMHLERTGFDAAPRLLGIDERGREVLSYLRGDVPLDVGDVEWTTAQLSAAASMLRSSHDRTAASRQAADQEVVCHSDFAPWNVVFTGDLPAGVIDFDDAAPGPRVRDVSYALWCWLGLGHPDRDVARQAARASSFCDAYGLADRSTLVAGIGQRQREIRARHLAVGRLQNAGYVESDVRWLQANGGALQARLNT